MKLIFVYNAKSGLVNASIDYFHKIIAPQSYACSLCKLTHGNFGMKAVVKALEANFEGEIQFLHSDEFETQFDDRIDYPAVLISINGKNRVVLPSKELEDFSSTEAFLVRLNNVLK